MIISSASYQSQHKLILHFTLSSYKKEAPLHHQLFDDLTALPTDVLAAFSLFGDTASGRQVLSFENLGQGGTLN